MKHAPQLLALGVACDCSGEPGSAPPPSPALIVIHGDPSDVPVHGLSAEWKDRFFAGDALFGETHNDADGIGPLYIRSSCGACHDAGARGPGFVEKFSTPGFELPFGSTRRPFATAGATQAIEPPPGRG